VADGANRASNSGNNWTSNGMGNNWTSDSMGNNWTSDGMGNNRASNGMGNRGGNNVREDSLAVVGDLGDVAFGIVGSVVDVLDATVRQVDRVVALPGSSAVVSLGSVKAGSRVVVSNCILVLVGGDLVGVDLSNGMGDWVSNGMTNNAMTNAVTNNAMSNAMANAMTNNAMADSHSMSNRVSDRSN